MAEKKQKKTVEKQPSDQPSFEQSLQQLEQIVQQLEDGGLGLTESLAKYEEGMQHLRRCYEALQQAERKIELLAGVDAEGNPIVEPFDDALLTLEEKQQARSRRRSKPADQGRSPRPTTDGNDVDEPGGLF